MGFLDGAESTDLIGLFLLSKTQHLGMVNGKFRDDGLSISWLTPRETENAAKKLSQIYASYGLKLEVKTNLSVVDYLDITLDLNTGLYAPYMKPNDVKNYVHKMSNHPPAVIKNIPKNINDRLCKLSSNEEIFNRAAQPYQEALVRANYDHKLTYYQNNNNNNSRKKNRTRTRNCIYFNPPYSKNVKTNIIAEFLKIVRNFPKHNILAPMMNTNKIKASYKTVPNMARQVSRKNGRILKQHAAPPPPSCNCQRSRKPDCPVPGNCTAKDVCYRCQVVRDDNHTCENYTGQTCRPIKTRIKEHLDGARKFDPAKPVGSRLSQHIGNLFLNNIPHTLNWSILSQNRHFSPVENFCLLCNVEKTFIIYHPEFSSLNFRNELFGYCFHKERYLLLNS